MRISKLATGSNGIGRAIQISAQIAALLLCGYLAGCEKHQPEELANFRSSSVSASVSPSPSAPHTAAAGRKPLKGLLDAGEKIAKITALVLGGIAAYYKFLRGRIFHPRLEISMASTILLVSGRYFLKVIANLKNTGASRVNFSMTHSALRVFAIADDPNEFPDAVRWERIATLDATERHAWVEAAETITLNWLVELPSTSLVALRSELLIAGDKTFWYADTIAEKDPLILSQPPQIEPKGDYETEKQDNAGAGLRRGAEANREREGGTTEETAPEDDD